MSDEDLAPKIAQFEDAEVLAIDAGGSVAIAKGDLGAVVRQNVMWIVPKSKLESIVSSSGYWDDEVLPPLDEVLMSVQQVLEVEVEG